MLKTIDFPSVNEQKDILKMALFYANLGWPVFPVHSVTSELICTCKQREDCSSPGKHPRTIKGLKDASTVPEQIESWWKVQWPSSNIGVVTGKQSGLFVIDIDPKNDGLSSFEELKNMIALPETLISITGSGGFHLFFQYPNEEMRNLINLLPGIDIRAEGGYIVAPPSLHVSGKSYEWKGKENNDSI